MRWIDEPPCSALSDGKAWALEEFGLRTQADLRLRQVQRLLSPSARSRPAR